MKLRAVMCLLVSLLILGSCVTTDIDRYAFDDLLAEDETVIIYYYGLGINIVEYNGVMVDWKAPEVGLRLPYFCEIRIPGGGTQFILSGYHYGPTTFHFSSVPFTYNFEKGKEYTVYINGTYVDIYDGFRTYEKIYYANSGMLARFAMLNGQTRVE